MCYAVVWEIVVDPNETKLCYIFIFREGVETHFLKVKSLTKIDILAFGSICLIFFD
jgi:hypothetical protein